MTEARIFWPSDYSGMIVHHLHAHPDLAQGRLVCDIGTGSGILAATALHLGAAEVVATDLDPDALAIACVSLARVAPATRFDLRQGSLWQALPHGSQFDLVLANLPNFPAEAIVTDGRRGWAGRDRSLPGRVAATAWGGGRGDFHPESLCRVDRHAGPAAREWP